MIAVIFEVWPQDSHRDEYLDIAAALRPMLTEIDGFISVERLKHGETSSCIVRHRPKAVRTFSRITG